MFGIEYIKVSKIIKLKSFIFIPFSFTAYPETKILHAINNLKKSEQIINKLSKNYIKEIASLANGDLKQAINNL